MIARLLPAILISLILIIPAVLAFHRKRKMSVLLIILGVLAFIFLTLAAY